MVIAGACTGKTTVVASRFVYLCSHYGISQDKILCISFTKKTIKDLKDRIIRCWPVEKGIPPEDSLEVHTFHRACLKIIADVHRARGIEVNKFLTSYDSLRLIKDILNIDYPSWHSAYEITKIIMRLRWICKSEEREFTEEDLKLTGIQVTKTKQAEKVLEKYPFKIVEEIYWKFDEQLQKDKSMTIDDILLDTRSFLKDEAILSHWTSRWDAILCDEFQDIDEVQFEILMKLCKNHHNVFCVGDPYQSITDSAMDFLKPFEQFESHFRALGVDYEVQNMEQNFRSTPQILNLSNQLISFHKGHSTFRKRLFTDNEDGSIPQIYVSSSEADQSKRVVQKITALQKQGVHLEDIAILAREITHISSDLKTALFNAKFYDPNLHAMDPLIEHQEIKFVIYWLNVAFLEESDKRWIQSLSKVYNIPTIKVGMTKFTRCIVDGSSLGSYIEAFRLAGEWDKNIHALWEKIVHLREIAKNTRMSLHTKCLSIVDVSKIKEHYSDKEESKTQRIGQFLDSPIFKDNSDWDVVLNQVDSFLFGDVKERVTCSTIHEAKGLEYEHVIVVNVSEGRFPSKKGLDMCMTPEQRDKYMDRERRLMYVACTRAKKSLSIFTDSEAVSPFIHDIESYSKRATN